MLGVESEMGCSAMRTGVDKDISRLSCECYRFLEMTYPKPLPELHITEMFDGSPPIEHVIKIADLTETGLTIGRNGDIAICGNIPKVASQNVSRKQATVYAINNPERDHPDIYLHTGYRGKDGQWAVSQSGTGVWLGDRPISNDRAVQLRPGTLLKIVPKVAGYQCILEWGAFADENGNGSGPPTVPMDAGERDRLYFENRTLKEQAAVKDIQIDTLQNLSRQHRTLAEEFEFQTKQLSGQIKKERDINKAQDKKIAKIRIFGAVAVGAYLLSLGIDIEQIEKLMEIIAIVASGGLLLASTGKSGTSEG